MKKTLILVPALVIMLFVSGNNKSANASSTSIMEVIADKSSTADSTATATAPTVVKSEPEKLDVVLYIMRDTTLQKSNAEVLRGSANGASPLYVTYPKPVVKDTVAVAANPEMAKDSLAEKPKHKYVPPTKPFKKVIIWGGGRDRYGNFTEECAAHANARLCRARIYSSGHSYQILAQFTPVINGYDHIELPNLSKISSWRGKFQAVLETHRKAADYVKENLDLSELIPGKFYAVNMYYTTSKYMLQFYVSAARQGTGTYATHVGVLYFDKKSGHWVVEHNIHGHVHRDALTSILGGKSNPYKYGVTAIARASK